jgi:(4S)-4-hydroxy-5-phosphonooxypentane-2,3-dione isomerase
MLANIAIYRIHSQHVEAFKERMLRHAETCLREERDCLRFDVNQSRDDPNLFIMYEIFRGPEALLAHAESAHTKDFARTRDDKGWLAERSVHQLDQRFP